MRSRLSELVALAALLALAGFLFRHGLTDPADFDEGVYQAATEAWRGGQQLGSEIFTAQPPGFYTLLRAGEAVFGGGISGGRWTIVATALLGLVGAFGIGRAVGGAAAGLGVAGLLAISPSYTTFSSRISADLPALALGLVALALLQRRGRVAAACAGALLVGSLSVKLSAATLAVPLVGIALARRPGRGEVLAFLGGGGAVVVAFAVAFRHSLGGIWHGAVTYHQDARGSGSIGDNVHRLAHFLDLRTPFAWLAIAAVLLALSPLRPRLRASLLPLWAWTVVSALFLLWHRPLHDNHLVLAAVALAVPCGAVLGAAAAALGGRRLTVAALAAAAVLAAGFVQERHRFAVNAGDQPEEVRWAAHELAARVPPGRLVLSDQPIVAVLAHRRMPGNLIDTAALRFDTGLLDDTEVLATIDRLQLPAVVADRIFRLRPALLRGLDARFPVKLRRGGATLYLRH